MKLSIKVLFTLAIMFAVYAVSFSSNGPPTEKAGFAYDLSFDLDNGLDTSLDIDNDGFGFKNYGAVKCVIIYCKPAYGTNFYSNLNHNRYFYSDYYESYTDANGITFHDSYLDLSRYNE